MGSLANEHKVLCCAGTEFGLKLHGHHGSDAAQGVGAGRPGAVVNRGGANIVKQAFDGLAVGAQCVGQGGRKTGIGELEPTGLGVVAGLAVFFTGAKQCSRVARWLAARQVTAAEAIHARHRAASHLTARPGT